MNRPKRYIALQVMVNDDHQVYIPTNNVLHFQAPINDNNLTVVTVKDFPEIGNCTKLYFCGSPLEFEARLSI